MNANQKRAAMLSAALRANKRSLMVPSSRSDALRPLQDNGRTMKEQARDAISFKAEYGGKE